MIHVRTGSRLHFGLLSLRAPAYWLDCAGAPTIPARRFGGAGLMIDTPGFELKVSRSAGWSADGPGAERALEFARRFAQTFPPDMIAPQHVHLDAAPPEHCGFGTGTQLGLAVVSALALSAGLESLDTASLARRLGRGSRSAVGTHGFARGGFLVDAGKRSADDIAPLVARADFPEAWRIVILKPRTKPGLHSDAEQCEFVRLLQQGEDNARTDALCKLVLLGMLPALAEGDLLAFGESLFEFNRRVGEAFAPAQGGIYASSVAADLVDFVRGLGVHGVGQSSWGPAAFAVVGDEEQAGSVLRSVTERFGPDVIEQSWVSRGYNRGALVTKCGGP